MKLFRALKSALAGGFVLTLAVGAFAQSLPQYATAVRIIGEARFSNDGGATWHPLIVGKVLGPGNMINSGADSTVDLVIGDKVATRVVPFPDKIGAAPDPNVRGLISYKASAAQNVIRMQGDTILAIDKASVMNMGADSATDTELDLQKGTIMGSVKKLSAASTYQIKTPNGMAAIRGTTFTLSADGKITVSDGSAVISVVINGQTITQTVVAGQQFDPATGQVTPLTPQAFYQAQQAAVEIFTVAEGVISFANDNTTVYVSPTSGNPNGGSPAWPF